MYKNLYMDKIGKKARFANNYLSNLDIKKKNAVLKQFATYLKTYSKNILKANQKDILKAKEIKSSMLRRKD